MLDIWSVMNLEVVKVRLGKHVIKTLEIQSYSYIAKFLRGPVPANLRIKNNKVTEELSYLYPWGCFAIVGTFL